MTLTLQCPSATLTVLLCAESLVSDSYASVSICSADYVLLLADSLVRGVLHLSVYLLH